MDSLKTSLNRRGSMYLNGFHFHADNLGRQVEAHHCCSRIREELFQCVICDGNTSGSRLIGIEYSGAARARQKPRARDMNIAQATYH